jgi:hypothetical protein
MPSPKKIKVVIDRSKWRTGKVSKHHTGLGGTNLLNDQGYMCCLGFCCKAAGVASKYLLHAGAPNHVVNMLRGSPLQRVLKLRGIRALTKICNFGKDNDKVHADASTLTSFAVAINDNALTTPEEKEQDLLELFKDSVFELEFTGSYSRK